MRITNQDRKSIVTMTHQYFDENAEVYLFGSRVDDCKKGGDIDLYITLEHKNTAEQMFEKKIKFLVALERLIGDQKVDVVIATDKSRPIEKEAMRTGIKL